MSNMVEVKLLPCPFCGGEAMHPLINGTLAPQVWCARCEVEMHPGKDGIPNADDQWNTRTPDQMAGVDGEVTQVDRNAASDFARAVAELTNPTHFGRIAKDAFARHRRAAVAAERKRCAWIAESLDPAALASPPTNDEGQSRG